MIVCHVAIATALGYRSHLEASHPVDLEYLMEQRGRGRLIAAGAAPDGTSCDLVCRVDQPGDVGKLVEGSPLFAQGLWTSYTPRSFAQFLEPWESPRPSSTRLATLVEGSAPDTEMASFALIEERGAGRMLLGGFFPGGEILALMTLADPAEAVATLDASGLFAPGSLRGRSLVHIV